MDWLPPINLYNIHLLYKPKKLRYVLRVPFIYMRRRHEIRY